jgi:hypothetical protein
MTAYRHTPDMGEISGFGGGYEEGCQVMLEAGVRWIIEHPEADPKFKGFKNVFGLLLDDNADAKALEEAIMNATMADGRRVGSEATGAMHQAVVMRCLAVKRLGWEEYCRQCREQEAKEVER